ncbi:hypothetical protein CQ018_05005 [Arthrobacter sp. MYb227]|uniref:SLC13 family permease n=1 Tax=Arthrobacter sp. MYb227 TaxID=1848601 RepID=UPI000CFD4C94|nr:SLC13 family permease [Arthrobacter sp. MYb227]PQZ94709.1 hypothetical protein CQ018_05005 [Arthrobacter sp. MYb227]
MDATKIEVMANTPPARKAISRGWGIALFGLLAVPIFIRLLPLVNPAVTVEDVLPILSIVIVIVAMISFVLEKIPIIMTALAAALLMAVTGVLKFEDVYGSFGSQVTVFCGAMMVVGTALFNTGFADLVARKFEALGLHRSERLLVTAVTLVTGCLSAFFSNTATVAIFIPLIAILANRSNGRIKTPIVLMGAGVGAAIGGVATLTGTTSQLITQGILIATPGATPMGMFTLSAIGVPLIIISVVYMGTIGYSIGSRVLNFEPLDMLNTGNSNDEIRSSAEPIASWKLPFSMLLMLGMIVAFAVGLWDLAIVALIGALVLVMTGCITLKGAIRGIDWNTLIIVSAAIAFGKGMTSAGGGQLLADSLVDSLGMDTSPWLVLGVLVVVCMVMTNFASNTALVAMFVPIAMTIAVAFDANPTSWAIVITIAANIAIATPVGTPSMTQTLVVGFRYMDFVKICGPLALILTACLILLAPFAYPF